MVQAKKHKRIAVQRWRGMGCFPGGEEFHSPRSAALLQLPISKAFIEKLYDDLLSLSVFRQFRMHVRPVPQTVKDVKFGIDAGLC